MLNQRRERSSYGIATRVPGPPAIEIVESHYAARFARTPEEIDAALALRFEVFNLELGEGLASSFLTGRDEDGYDAVCDHLMVVERATDRVVGTYRLMRSETALSSRGFYSTGEFDLSALPNAVLADGVELGRACVAREHRNTRVLYLLWKGIAAYMTHAEKRYLFGCCSLTSGDPRDGESAARRLEAGGHAHHDLRAPARPGFECVADDERADLGRPARLPRLFDTYLRFGAKVCSPPAIDRAFGTIDFLVVFDAAEMDGRTRRMFFGGGSDR
jgi:putative hemolysin